MPNVSIVVCAQDNFSSAIKSMSQVTRGFSKDAEDMQKKLDMLNKNKVSLRVEADKARTELRALEKQFAATGDEADGLKMQLANENFENLRRNLSLVSKGAKDVEKSMSEAINTSNKMENRAGLFGKVSDIGKAMFAQGVGSMMGQALMTSTLNSIGSKYGDEAGTMASNIFSSMASMATMGAMIAGPAAPIGALIGGVAGAGLGAFNGASQNQQKKDDAFKGVVQSEYERVNQQQQNDMMSGSAIASQREIDAIAFEKLLGSKDISDSYLSDIRTMANTTPFLYSDLTAMSKTLAPAFGDDTDMMKKLLDGIGNAGASTGLGVSDMSMVATALGRMQSTGKTSLEYLNLLQERGIDAYQFVADGKGTSKEAVLKEVSAGNIAGADAVQYILDGLQKSFAGAMEAQSKTFGGLSSTAEGWQQETQAAMGEGYNEERKKGMQDQVDWISGEQGKQMSEGNKLIGQYKASLENEREQAIRDAQAKAMDSAEYQKALAEGNGAEAGRLLMEAQVKAENEYKKSEGYQLYLETETEMVNNLRADLSKGWENFGYSMSQQFTLGIERGRADLWKQLNPNEFDKTILPNRVVGDNGLTSTELNYSDFGFDPTKDYTLPNRMPGYAFGLAHVPYDNFPALLHQGERVLTASEARAANRGASAPPITITGNQFTVREEADIDRIAAELARQLEKARMIYAN